jgi:amino acid transporter
MRFVTLEFLPSLLQGRLDQAACLRIYVFGLAVLVAATLLAVGIALIAVWAVRAFNMLGAAEADRAPIKIGVLTALAVPVVVCLIAYAAVRAVAAPPRVDGRESAASPPLAQSSGGKREESPGRGDSAGG